MYVNIYAALFVNTVNCKPSTITCLNAFLHLWQNYNGKQINLNHELNLLWSMLAFQHRLAVNCEPGL